MNELTAEEILRVKEKARQPETCPRCGLARFWDHEEGSRPPMCSRCAHYAIPPIEPTGYGDKFPREVTE